MKSVSLEIKVVKNNMEHTKRRKEIRNIMELIVTAESNHKGKHTTDRRCLANIIIIVCFLNTLNLLKCEC